MAKTILNFKLSVSLMREGNQFIAYSPALDLSTCANTYKKAKKRFEEIVNIFFEELIKNKTLEQTLKDLGWKKKQKQWTPPVLISNEYQNFEVSV